MNDKEYHLSRYDAGVYFTADGQNVIFRDDTILMPASTWKRDDITVDKIIQLHQQDVDDIRLRELSLDEYIQILEKIENNNGAEEIKKIKDERYPKDTQ
jgi:hypothetical protein